jgi:hypothetical protein
MESTHLDARRRLLSRSFGRSTLKQQMPIFPRNLTLLRRFAGNDPEVANAGAGG